jgi:hypothetical protein
MTAASESFCSAALQGGICHVTGISHVTACPPSRAAKKFAIFVGRGFSRDIRFDFPSGVLTPESSKTQFPANNKNGRHNNQIPRRVH